LELKKELQISALFKETRLKFRDLSFLQHQNYASRVYVLQMISWKNAASHQNAKR
jgi:hypothetical protein